MKDFLSDWEFYIFSLLRTHSFWPHHLDFQVRLEVPGARMECTPSSAMPSDAMFRTLKPPWEGEYLLHGAPSISTWKNRKWIYIYIYIISHPLVSSRDITPIVKCDAWMTSALTHDLRHFWGISSNSFLHSTVSIPTALQSLHFDLWSCNHANSKLLKNWCFLLLFSRLSQFHEDLLQQRKISRLARAFKGERNDIPFPINRIKRKTTRSRPKVWTSEWHMNG